MCTTTEMYDNFVSLYMLFIFIKYECEQAKVHPTKTISNLPNITIIFMYVQLSVSKKTAVTIHIKLIKRQ